MLISNSITKLRQSIDIVSIKDAMQYLRTDVCSDSELVGVLIENAIEVLQNYTGLVFRKSLVKSTYTQSGGDRLFIYFCNNVDKESVHKDLKGVDGMYYLDTTDCEINLEYIAGYDDEFKVPATIKMAILQQVAYMYENRELTNVSPLAKLNLYSFKTHLAI